MCNNTDQKLRGPVVVYGGFGRCSWNLTLKLHVFMEFFVADGFRLEGGRTMLGQLAITASTQHEKICRGDTFLITFWSKTKPPPTEKCSGSKMNCYTVTLEMESKNRIF